MTAQPQLLPYSLSPADVVYTPDWCARDMVEWFKPSGRILEPCRGEGAIYKYLPAGTEWCEIADGRDFFAWHSPVDWIVSNPPYSIFNEWMDHSFNVSENVVYLLSLSTFFTSFSRMRDTHKRGWIKHVRVYGEGNKLGFPTGRPMGAFHFVRAYDCDPSWSWYSTAPRSRRADAAAAPR